MHFRLSWHSRHGIFRPGTIWNSTARHGAARFGLTRHRYISACVTILHVLYTPCVITININVIQLCMALQGKCTGGLCDFFLLLLFMAFAAGRCFVFEHHQGNHNIRAFSFKTPSMLCSCGNNAEHKKTDTNTDSIQILKAGKKHHSEKEKVQQECRETNCQHWTHNYDPNISESVTTAKEKQVQPWSASARVLGCRATG